MAPVRGLGTRAVTFFTGSGLTARKFEVDQVVINSDELDQDWLSFGDEQEGEGYSFTLGVRMVQDPGTADSLWNYMFENRGASLAFRIHPNGWNFNTKANNTISATNPAFDGVAIVSLPSGTLLGGELDRSRTNRFTVEVEWQVDGGLTRVTAPAGP